MTGPTRQIAMPVLGAGASDFYRAELDRLHAQHHGDGPSPVLAVATDFAAINANLPDNYPALLPLLDTLFNNLAATGAPLYLLPNITLHSAVDRLHLPATERAKIVHPLACAIAALQARHIERITLAGTRHTMASSQLAGYFVACGITVDFPGGTVIDALDALRLAVFEHGVTPTLKEEMGTLLSIYDNVVLACTELSMLNTADIYIDVARLQMAAAIERL